MSVQRRPCIICADLNIHIDDDNDVHAKKLGELLQTFDWVQHVREPTHTAGHILDVVIMRCDTEVQQLSVGSFCVRPRCRQLQAEPASTGHFTPCHRTKKMAKSHRCRLRDRPGCIQTLC